MKSTRVLVVDDSPTARLAFGAALAAHRQLDVDVAPNPGLARSRMEYEWPDVIVLDLERNGYAHLGFLNQVMAERPTPIVVSSSLAPQQGPMAVRALAEGAVDFLEKPTAISLRERDGLASELATRLMNAASTRVFAGGRSGARPAVEVVPSPGDHGIPWDERVVAIGAATGGTRALERVLSSLPENSPPILVVQHMPGPFTSHFAERLDDICAIEVREASHGAPVLPGQALIAGGGHHLTVFMERDQLVAGVSAGPEVNGHRPSVDVLFYSMARIVGKNAVGIIMTGMGDDGARGLKEMRDKGAYTIAQDDASCAVFGMPKEAVRLGAVEATVTLADLPGEIISPRWIPWG